MQIIAIYDKVDEHQPLRPISLDPCFIETSMPGAYFIDGEVGHNCLSGLSNFQVSAPTHYETLMELLNSISGSFDKSPYLHKNVLHLCDSY